MPRSPDTLVDSHELRWVLALVRERSLPAAARRLGVDTSSVYRAIKRLEKRLGRALFEGSARGMVPSALALRLAERAAAIEAELGAAQALLQDERGALAGTVRVTTNDLLLHGVLMPALAGFLHRHPRLAVEVSVSNELARLDRREADIALRGTIEPPAHLVGARLGTLRVSLWASRSYLERLPAGTPPERMTWAAPEADPHLGDYPSRRWRLARYPTVTPALRLDSMLAVVRAIEAGVAVGMAPDMLLAGQPGLVNLSGPIESIAPECWLLTRADLRAQSPVMALFHWLRTQPWPG